MSTWINYSSVASGQEEVRAVASVAALPGHTYTPVLTAALGLDVTLDANLSLANATIAGIATGSQVRITTRQDSTGYRSVAWGSNYKGLTNVIPRQGPGLETEYVFELNADQTLTLVSHSGIDTTRPVSILDFGAVPSTDCYAAIQALLNLGLDSYWPTSAPLNYQVSQPLLLQTSGQKIFAEVGAQVQAAGGHIMPLIAITPPIGSYPGLPTVAALLTGSGAAAHFDGTGNWWLGLGDNARVTLNGLAQFEVEFAVNFDTIASNVAPIGCASYDIDGTGITTFRWGLNSPSGGRAPCGVTTHIGGVQVSANSSVTLTNGTTYKIAVSYDGAHLRLFVDGNKEAEVAATGTVDQLLWSDWCVGKSPQFMCESGYVLQAAACALDGVRISDTARHTASYTPSTAKPTWDSNTIALLNFDNEVGQWSRCYSRGYFNEQQQHWIFVRRELANTPAFVSGCEVHNLFCNDGIGINSGVWAIHATDITLVDVSANSKIKLQDNCFNFTMLGGHITVDASERDAIMLGNACGASIMVGTKITGGKYQMRMLESGISVIGARMQPSAGTVACFVSNGFAAGDDPTLDLVGISVDGETILTGTFQAGVIGIGLHTLNLVGGTWDVPNAAAPVAKLSNCSKVTAQGAFLKVNSSAQEIFSKAGACNPVTVYNAFKYPTTAPWSNTSGFVQVDDGATRTNFKGLSTTDTPAANLAGTAVCTGGSGATFSFNLPTAEADASYQLVFTAKSSTGSPAAGSNRVKAYTPGTTSVSVTLEADPGAGNTITFSWMLIRA